MKKHYSHSTSGIWLVMVAIILCIIVMIRCCLLAQDEEAHRPFVSRVINHLANYQGGVVPNVKQQKMHRQESSDATKSRCLPKKKKQQRAADKKAVIVNFTYCPRGGDDGLYCFRRSFFSVSTITHELLHSA